MYLCTDYHFNKLKNNTKMKKVQTLMLMLLVAVMGMTVQSCSKEETKTISGETDYFRKPLTDLNYKGRKLPIIQPRKLQAMRCWVLLPWH